MSKLLTLSLCASLIGLSASAQAAEAPYSTLSNEPHAALYETKGKLASMNAKGVTLNMPDKTTKTFNLTSASIFDHDDGIIKIGAIVEVLFNDSNDIIKIETTDDYRENQYKEKKKKSTSFYQEVEGLITNTEAESFTITTPYQETLNLSYQNSKALNKGMLIEAKVDQDGTVGKLEREEDLEVKGLLKDETNSSITIEHGKQAYTFEKANHFAVDDEKPAKGDLVEIELNEQLKAVEMERDD